MAPNYFTVFLPNYEIINRPTGNILIGISCLFIYFIPNIILSIKNINEKARKKKLRFILTLSSLSNDFYNWNNLKVHLVFIFADRIIATYAFILYSIDWIRSNLLLSILGINFLLYLLKKSRQSIKPQEWIFWHFCWHLVIGLSISIIEINLYNKCDNQIL